MFVSCTFPQSAREASLCLTSGRVVNASEKPEADITVTRPVTLSARPSVRPKHQNNHSTRPSRALIPALTCSKKGFEEHLYSML